MANACTGAGPRPPSVVSQPLNVDEMPEICESGGMSDLADIQARIAKLHQARLLDALTDRDQAELAELYEREAELVIDLRDRVDSHAGE